MYVIFPLEELLDLHSTATGPKSSQSSGSDPRRSAPGQLQQQALPGPPQQPALVPARPPVSCSPTPHQHWSQPLQQPTVTVPQHTTTYNIIQSQQRAGKAAHSQSPSVSSSGSPGAAPSTVPSSNNSGSSSQGSQAQLPKGRGRPLRQVQVTTPGASPRGGVKQPQPEVGVVGVPAGPPSAVAATVVQPDSSSIIASPGGGTRNLLTPPVGLPGRTPPPERANRSSWAGSPTASSDGGIEGQKGITVGRSSSFRRDSGPESQGSGTESNKPIIRQNSFRSIRDATNLPVRAQTVADRKRLEHLQEKKAAVAYARCNPSPPAGVDSKRSSESEPTCERADSTTTIIEKSEKRNNCALEIQPQETETNQNSENKNQESVGQKAETPESVGLTKVSVELSDSVTVSEEVNPLSADFTVVSPHSIVTPLPPKALRGDNFPPSLGGVPSSSSTTDSRPSIVSRRNQAYLTLPRKYPSASQRSAAMAGEVTLKDLTNPAYIEPVKAHNNVTFKLVKTVSDFTGQLSRLHEQHAEGIQRLVETYRKENSKLRNERPACGSAMFAAWDSLLQEVEADSQVHSDVAATLARQVSRPLIEKTFYRKIQSRKVFTHRENFDTILARTEDMLKKCRREYNEAYVSHSRTQSNASLAAYFDAHNAYVQQLHSTNGMLSEYHHTSLPSLMEELESVYMDVSSVVADCILQGADIIATKAGDQHRRYEGLSTACRNADGRHDITSLIRCMEHPLPTRGPLHRFQPPALPPPQEGPNGDLLPQDPPVGAERLKNELVMDRLANLSSRNRYETLRKEQIDLDKQIQQLQEQTDGLSRVQLRSLESSLYNKANEIQEDLSIKKFDLRVAQVHLSAVKAQKELFGVKDSGGAEGRERKMSNSSTGSMRSKWMKAFKSLKTPNAPQGAEASKDTKKNGRGDKFDPMFESHHIFQEYTYKKITACDVCQQILRGHSRQGLKCRMCKVNVHVECQEKVPKCQPKTRMLRRQRSTSEIESNVSEAGEDEMVNLLRPISLVENRGGQPGL